ncbi:DUF4240 domain-containing protein [Hespellia stercorisuis]|uniref:DUF4240 domain-containing protein n=1 Tax=Hespellia stercorisuis DSM 15480 TaxID=1121950 RepID=A0A1M6TCC3_9FIRM|nr:DUF4240 domain-containing protein [Hespellia stercorisuis]SHK54486.1 Protein of unknown function [Hespellia stercorisuis DSM 15480]
MSRKIEEINKDTFWQLIEEAKMQCGKDLNASLWWIKKGLLRMPPEHSLQFHRFLHAYYEAASRYGLWTAVNLIKEEGCTYEEFVNFKAWLVGQGKEVYMAALANPDSLVAVEKYENCEFELLSYVGNEIYKEQTGRSAYDDCTQEMDQEMLQEVSKDIKYHPMIDYPLELPDELLAYPQISAQFMKETHLLNPKSYSTWDIPFPEIKEQVKKRAIEAKKYIRSQQKKDKIRKQEEQSR